MTRGFKLKDGSIWTIISYDVTEEYKDTVGWKTPISAITSVTGVEYEEGCEHTHPLKANFSDCLFDTFDVNDPRLECIVDDVFPLIFGEDFEECF